MKALDVDRFPRRWTMFLFIVTWSLSSLCRSLLQKQVSFYEEGGKKIYSAFHRPVFLNFIMALSMMPAGLIDIARKKWFMRGQQTTTKIPTIVWILLPVCGFLDIFQCWTLNRAIYDVGLQLGSLLVTFDLIFIPLIEYFFLRMPMFGYVIFSVATVVICTILIAVSDNQSSSSSLNIKNPKYPVTIGLQILGEMCRGLLYVIKEHILHNTDLTCERYVSYLGMYDFIINLFILSPIVHFVHDGKTGSFYENMCTSFEMLFNSKYLVFVAFTYLVVSFFMNIMNTRYIYYTNAINLAICSGFSASINWALETIIKMLPRGTVLDYFINEEEELDYWYILKFICYIGVFFALLVFSKTIKLSCFEYPEETRYVVTMADIETN